MEPIVYLETGSLDPAYNLAFEEYILTHRLQGSYLLLWQNENTVVIGQNQNAEAEINRAFVEENHIRVIRRITGGGAVYHDRGNLNYSFITDAEAGACLAMDRFTKPIAEALQKLGLNAEASGRNDILVDRKKVSGTAQRIWKNRILHHGTLLFDSNPDMIVGALNAAPEKFRSKSSKSVRSRIGTIRSALPEDMDLSEFCTFLKQTLAGTRLWQGALTKEELSVVERLKVQKYDTWEWTFGCGPQYELLNRRYWRGGGLEICAEIRDGKIMGIRFVGDFLSQRSLDEVVDALRYCPFRSGDVEAILERFNLSEFFGGITRQEILQTMFYLT